MNTRFGTAVPYSAGTLDQVELYLDEDVLHQPIHWKKSRKVFTCSMTDLFGRWVPEIWLDRIYAIQALTPQHTYMNLTKRPDRRLTYLAHPDRKKLIAAAALDSKELPIASGRYCHQAQSSSVDCDVIDVYEYRAKGLCCFSEDFGSSGTEGVDDRHDCHVSVQFTGLEFSGLEFQFPLRNVREGVTVVNQDEANRLVPILLHTPAVLRWLSIEPMLGPVDFSKIIMDDGDHLDTLYNDGTGTGLGWVVCGGESGQKARPMSIQWVRLLRDQCMAAGVPLFFKQWGEFAPARLQHIDSAVNHTNGRHHFEFDPSGSGESKRIGKKSAGRLLDGREWNEVPEVSCA
jgi:protein gp37